MFQCLLGHCRSFTNRQWYCFNDQSVSKVGTRLLHTPPPPPSQPTFFGTHVMTLFGVGGGGGGGVELPLFSRLTSYTFHLLIPYCSPPLVFNSLNFLSSPLFSFPFTLSSPSLDPYTSHSTSPPLTAGH